MRSSSKNGSLPVLMSEIFLRSRRRQKLGSGKQLPAIGKQADSSIQAQS